MSTTIESLQVEVQSNATSAVSGIDTLASSLGKLKSAVKGGVGLTAVTKQLTTLNTALNSISGENADNLNKLAQGLQTLSSCGNLKLSSSVSTQITNIGNAVKSLNGTDFSVPSRLATSLAPLENIGKSNLNSFISQLQRLPQAVQALQSVNIGVFGTQIGQLTSALAPMSQMGKNNLTSFITQLSKIPKLMQDLKSVDMRTLYNQIQSLTRVFTPLATQMQAISAGFASFPNRIQRLIQTTDNLSASNNRASKSYTNLAAKIGIAYVAMKKVAHAVGSWITKSNEYVEDLNLFTASMGEYTAEAKKYAEQIGEVLGIDPAEWMRNQGIFMTITKGFGVASDRAYTMSQNLTQLGYDISSFFNISFADATQKLQSGIAGELEPLRRLGYDLSVARLQQEAYTLGIKKKVSAMTQAEKAELRYYAIMTQVTTAQGDMARTLDAPANQLRILRALVTQCARAFGNIFIPALNASLPYAIALTKVLRMVADVIARLSGFSLPEIDYSGLSNTAGGAADVANSLGDATKKAKKLKNALLGIDELNVISLPKDSSGSSADGISGGSGLGFELPTYDFLGDAVNSKVQAIVDKMKEWLGITGEINNWSDFFNTRLGKILIAVGLIGSAFLLWKISKPFVATFNVISSLFGGREKGGGKSKGFSVPSPKVVLKGLADIAVIIGGVIAIVETIGLLMQIPGFEQTAKKGIKAIGIVFSGLWGIILPLTAVSAGMVALGKIGVATVAKGFADFAIIVGGAAVLITAIGALISIPYFSDFLATGINSVVSVFNGLWEVALPIGALSALLVVLGIASPAVILSGLAGFALVIGGVELVLVALGALNQIPGFSWIVGEGGKVLIQLGEILGGFAGSIVNGFLGEVSNSFPEIGENLAGFMTEAQPFFTGLESINAESVDAVKKLAEMVLILTAADVLDGLTSWFTGGSSMTKFGKELCAFAPYFVQYSKAIKGVDGNAVQASATAAKALSEFANNIPNSGGVAGFFAGENDIDIWGAKLPSFGKNFKKYSDSVKGVDGNAVQASATAAESIANFAKNIPNEGGVVSWFTGDNNVDVWGEKLPKFGRYFKQYSETVSGVKGDVVTASSAAAESIANFAKNIPNEGGVVSWFTGDNSIDVWGAKLPEFGKNFLLYYNYIKNVKNDVVTASSAAVQSILGFANNIPNSGGVASWFAGDNSISSFADELVIFGQRFKSYYDYVSGITIGKISSVSSEMNKILDWSVRVSSTDSRDIESFGKAIRNLGKDFASCGGNIIEGFTGKITSAYTTSKSSVVSWGSNVKTWFTGTSYGDVNKTRFGTFATDIVNGFKDKITSSSGDSKSSTTSWAYNVKLWFTSNSYGGVNKETFGRYATDIVNGFESGIASQSESARDWMITWANNTKKHFTDVVSSSVFYDVAKDVIKGFNNGINDFYDTSRPYMKRWANDAKATYKKALDSNSPSKEFMRIGEDTVLGYNLGVATLGKTTRGVVNSWAESITSISPAMSFVVDTSALEYYSSDSFTKSISANVTSTNRYMVDSAMTKELLKEAMLEALNDSRIAENTQRQADKNEQTIVQIGNRTVTDAVTTQQKANGYVFAR